MIFEHSKAHPLIIGIGTGNMERNLTRKIEEELGIQIWASSIFLLFVAAWACYFLITW